MVMPIEILQRKAIRLVARAKYTAHTQTDPLFRMFKILNHCNLLVLNQNGFVYNFKNKNFI